MTVWSELKTGVGRIGGGPCYTWSRGGRGRGRRWWTWNGESGETKTAVCFQMENGEEDEPPLKLERLPRFTSRAVPRNKEEPAGPCNYADDAALVSLG